MKKLTLGSLFDGLGGWLVSAVQTGAIEPVFSSEIDPIPAAMSKKHFPDVMQLGDITKLDGSKIPPVDIICAGSPCFVAGTSILTHGGMKAVEHVKVGNAVLGDDCKWHRVVKTMVNPTNAVYTIKAQGLLETKATANHPIYVRHMKRHYPTCEDGRRGNERVFSKPEYVAVNDLKKGDFIGFPILQYENNRMNVTPEEAWLVGRYIADGYVNNSQRSNRPKGQYNHKVIYCIGKGKVEHFKAHVEKYHVCLKKDATVTKGEIISERLMFFCMMCGKGAGEKEIPGDFLNLPKNLLKALIEGYMSGDGCKRNGINKATTISRDLALSLQVAVHKVYGVPAKIYFTKRPPKAVIQGREINQHDTYQVTWLDEVPKQSQAVVEDGYVWQPIREVTKEEVKTLVYNFEVKDVNSYTANGMMVHNCQDLSVAGKRKGLAGSRSGLYVHSVRLVKEMLEATKGKYPSFFVFENVPGLLSTNKGEDFKACLDMMQDLGFLPDGNMLDAQYMGVAQRRKRIFITWVRTDYLLKKNDISTKAVIFQLLTEVQMLKLKYLLGMHSNNKEMMRDAEDSILRRKKLFPNITRVSKLVKSVADRFPLEKKVKTEQLSLFSWNGEMASNEEVDMSVPSLEKAYEEEDIRKIFQNVENTLRVAEKLMGANTDSYDFFEWLGYDVTEMLVITSAYRKYAKSVQDLEWNEHLRSFERGFREIGSLFIRCTSKARRSRFKVLPDQKIVSGNTSESKTAGEDVTSRPVQSSEPIPLNTMLCTRGTTDNTTGSGIGNHGDKAYTLMSNHEHAVFIPPHNDELDKNQALLVDVSHRQDVVRVLKGDKTNCLAARMGTGGNNVPLVCYSIQGNTIDRKPQNGGNGLGVTENIAPTLNTVDKHAVYVKYSENGSS